MRGHHKGATSVRREKVAAECERRSKKQRGGCDRSSNMWSHCFGWLGRPKKPAVGLRRQQATSWSSLTHRPSVIISVGGKDGLVYTVRTNAYIPRKAGNGN